MVEVTMMVTSKIRIRARLRVTANCTLTYRAFYVKQ